MSFFIVFFLLSHFNPLAPRGASGLKYQVRVNPDTIFFGLAPRGASGLKFCAAVVGQQRAAVSPREGRVD